MSLRIGFRRVAIADGLLTVNGHRVQFHGVNRHEFDPRSGRVVDGGADAPRHRADEGAQRQRGAHEPLSAASALPGSVRRARALRDRRVRSRDTWVHGARLAWQSGRRPGVGGRARRPHAAHGRARQEPPVRRSCGRSATRAGWGAGSARWRTGRAAAIRRVRCTTSTTGPAATSTSTRACTPPTRRSTRSDAGRNPRSRTRRRTRAGGACRSCCASTPTRWATGRAAWPTTRRCSSATRAARAASSGSGSTTVCGTRRAGSSPTAGTSASRCTTRTSSPTGSSSPTARPRRACSSSRRSSSRCRSAWGRRCGSRTG